MAGAGALGGSGVGCDAAEACVVVSRLKLASW